LLLFDLSSVVKFVDPPITMSDWAKLRVADLKEECKARGIPLTGLKLKQQYIDKLEEHEAASRVEPDVPVNTEKAEDEALPSEEAHLNGDPAEPSHDDAAPGPQHADEDTAPAPTADDEKATGLPIEGSDTGNTLQTPQEPLDAGNEPEAGDHAPAAPEAAQDPSAVPEPAEPSEGMQGLRQDDMEISAQTGTTAPRADASSAKPDDTQEPSTQESGPSALPTDSNLIQPESSGSTPQVAPKDLVEDQKRRRKRSVTPEPSAEEVARKRARLSNDTEDLKVTQTPAVGEASTASDNADEMVQDTTTEAAVEAIVDDGSSTRVTEAIIEPPAKPEEATEATEAVASDTKTSGQLPPTSPRRSRSPPSDEERDVPPAVHPATSSLYIRNFKRPLHIPSLRSHLVSLARSRSASSDDADPITLFYLDNIRTHAFVSFRSLTAASRVRIALHDTRFPDEPMREPLFVDFVPDDKVQSWIDTETGGGGGFGRSAGAGGRRFEVIYEEGDDGPEAIFQEVGAGKPRPGLQASRATSHMSPSIDRRPTEQPPLAPGVHPDRASLVPSEPRDVQSKGRAPPTGPRNAAPTTNTSSTGKGFKALDELFPSTTAKPKLYYKPVPEAVAEERLDMFRDLRPGYAAMGRSGDEGMKRYSFERYKNREEWADKGPEFGYGRRGQDRLTGARGFGGARPMGGYRGRGGGDSWRGGGGR
jgi:hypothetical protein